MFSRVWKQKDNIYVICILLGQQQIFELHFEAVVTCVKISLAKILFPCFIIMLTNLLKSKDKNDQLT